MASNPNSLKNLKPPFSATNQPKKRAGGRKPQALKKFTKDNNLEITDIIKMVKFVIPLDQDELETLLLDRKIPLIMRIFTKALLKDLKNGNMGNVLQLVERAFGKPQEHHHLSGSVSSPKTDIDYSNLTDEEAKMIWNQAMNPDKE